MEEAIYHLRVKTTSRSRGESAISRAAYRSGTCLADERTGTVFDYRRKGGVLHQELIFGAGWEVVDRETLWNRAEALETRKNSTTAREFEITLPLGLSPEGRIEVARDFTRYLTDRFGFAADLAIHQPDKWNRGQRANLEYENVHAHIFCTTRDASGKKTRALDDKKSGAILEVREKWAEICNNALERAGCEARISAARKPLEAYDNEIARLDAELAAVTAEGDRAIAALDAAKLAVGRAGGGTASPVCYGLSGRENLGNARIAFETLGRIFERVKGASLGTGGSLRIHARSSGQDWPIGNGHEFNKKPFENIRWQIANWMSICRIQKNLLATIQGVRDGQEDGCRNLESPGSKKD